MFTIRTLLLAVAVVAIGVVGLTTRNVWWASVFATLTWMSVAAAILSAIVYRGSSRWFAIGFSVCSAFYLAINFMQSFQPVAGALISSRVVVSAWQAIDIPKPQPPRGSSGYSAIIDSDVDLETIAMYPYLGLAGSTNEEGRYYLELRSFYVVAHCLWAFFFGFLGALLAGYLGRERLREETAARGNPPG